MTADSKHSKYRRFLRILFSVLLLSFNVIGLLAGLGQMGITTWHYLIQDSLPYFFHDFSSTAMILHMVSGAGLFVITLIGCGASIISLFSGPRVQLVARILLIVLASLLTLLYSLNLVATAVQWYKFCDIKGSLGEMYTDAVTSQYGQPGYDALTATMNELHQQGRCCGYRGGDDFISSRWISAQLDTSLRPFSCCSVQSAACSARLSTYLGDTGCQSIITDTITYFYWSLLGVAFTSLAVQLLLMGTSLLLISCCI